MFRRLLGLVIGIPLIMIGVVVALLAVVGFVAGDASILERVLAFFFAVISLALLVIGARACRKTNLASEPAAAAVASPVPSETRLAKNDIAWRYDGATEPQKKLARKLGISFTNDISKGELADLLSDAKGEPRFQGGETVAQRQKKQKKRAKDRLKMAKEQIRFMNQANRDYGGEGIFAGFRFSRLPDRQPSPEEQPYVGTFLPIQVASKYPHLLSVETIDYDDVMCDQRLKRGAKMVVKPGKFKKL